MASSWGTAWGTAWGNSWGSISAPTGPPADPTLQNTDNITAFSARANWDDNSANETAFYFRYRVTGAGSWTDVVLPANTDEYVFSSLVAEEDYEWQVAAFNGELSNYTTLATFTTLAAPSYPAVDQSDRGFAGILLD
jgi:hypothetical protein